LDPGSTRWLRDAIIQAGKSNPSPESACQPMQNASGIFNVILAVYVSRNALIAAR
jgi:hypothetical protein